MIVYLLIARRWERSSTCEAVGKRRVLLRVGVGLTLAFIYVPLGVIALYALSSSTTLEWPPQDSSTGS